MNAKKQEQIKEHLSEVRKILKEELSEEEHKCFDEAVEQVHKLLKITYNIKLEESRKRN